MKNLNLLFLSLTLLGLAACSPKLSPFTQDLYEELALGEEELRRIQFYLSRDLTLVRELRKGEAQVSGGKIKVVEGRRVEVVRIPRGTPGVYVFSPKSNRFAISFEEGDDRYLMFGPNPKAGGRFVLLASEWKRRRGWVTYGGKRYEVEGEEAWAHLLVDLKKIRKVAVQARTVKGRRVN